MISLTVKALILSMPLLLVMAPADAQTQKKATPRELSDAAIEARTKCGQEALARPQSSDEFRASPSPRYIIYTTCMKKAGFRP